MKTKTEAPKKSLSELRQQLIKLKLDLKVNKLKDTSQLKKIRYQITIISAKG